MSLKKILFIFVIMFMFIVNVNALKLEFSGNSTITNDIQESLTIKLKLEEGDLADPNASVENISFSLDYDESLIDVSIDKENDFGYASKLNNKEIWIYSAGKSIADNEILKLNIDNKSMDNITSSIKIGSNVKLNGNDITISEVEKELNLKYKPTTTTRVLNTSAKIKNITATNSTMKPAFSDSIKDYKIYVSKDTIKQITIKSDYEMPGVTLAVSCKTGCTSDTTIPNKLNLIMGKNEATFVYTSEDGKKEETYNFVIYRGPTTDGSNKLASLSVDGFQLKEEFKSTSLDYNLTIPYDVESINVNALAEDEAANIKIKDNEELKVGENVVTITVTSNETEEKMIYNITVVREEFTPISTTTTKPIVPVDDKKDDNNTLLIVLLAIGGSVIIGLSAYFIFFKKSKPKKNDKKKVDIKEEKDAAISKDDNKEIEMEKTPTTVDDALKDLMETKQYNIK